MDARMVDLHRFADERGSLTAIESNEHIPFEIERVFYLYEVPPNNERGHHAHEETEQFIVSLAGSVEVRLDDGTDELVTNLQRPNEGLYVPPRTWVELRSFSANARVLVLASASYDPDDYIHDYKALRR